MKYIEIKMKNCDCKKNCFLSTRKQYESKLNELKMNRLLNQPCLCDECSCIKYGDSPPPFNVYKNNKVRKKCELVHRIIDQDLYIDNFSSMKEIYTKQYEDSINMIDNYKEMVLNLKRPENA